MKNQRCVLTSNKQKNNKFLLWFTRTRSPYDEVAYFTPKKGAAEPSSTTAGAGLAQQSVAKSNWKKLQKTIRAGAIKNRPALRFANAVLAKVAIDLRRRRGSVAMEELFPDFDWQSVSELKRMASLKGGLNLKKLKLED